MSVLFKTLAAFVFTSIMVLQAPVDVSTVPGPDLVPAACSVAP